MGPGIKWHCDASIKSHVRDYCAILSFKVKLKALRPKIVSLLTMLGIRS